MGEIALSHLGLTCQLSNFASRRTWSDSSEDVSHLYLLICFFNFANEKDIDFIGAGVESSGHSSEMSRLCDTGTTFLTTSLRPQTSH